jgi:hypothetical protein
VPGSSQPGVKKASVAAYFHGFGMALSGSWNSVEKSL